MMKRRVVVTGMGVLTPIGNNVLEFGQGLREGVCGAGPITAFDTAGFPVRRAFEVKNFDPKSSTAQALDPFIQYAVEAAGQAFIMAGFDPAEADPYRVGISASSSKGGVHTIDRFAGRFAKNRSAILGARIYSSSVPNFGAQWIARRWKIHGPAKCYIAACATGTVSVIEGAKMVEDGVVDYCIAGSSDASIVPLMMAGYYQMGALAPDSLRPFDRRRNGFMVGEGAGMVFLETLESARGRGAQIYGEILGSAYGSDSTDPIKFDIRSGALSRTIDTALERCGLDASEIGYINLHGTGTPFGDLYETHQIKQAFGEKARRISMSSIKGMTGHMLGASGAVEIIATLIGMQQGWIPPTIGLEEADPECDLDYTPGRAKKTAFQKALSLSLGFGGHVAVIALGKV
jgi:3-oxoacyl-[acyl-carrier-protein] synthase II